MPTSRSEHSPASPHAAHQPPRSRTELTSQQREGSSSVNDFVLAELLEQLTDQRMSADGSVRRAFPSPDVIEARLHGHPHADRLRSLLPTLQILASLNDASALTQRREEREAAERAASQSEIGGTTNTPQLELGEFSLLRVIGRGGMGIVYEAEQRSLRRRVAVKILPLAGLLDDRLLKRFHIEAQAAACLTHENIVPIYCVGCDRDIHYYAMQFIDGDSLADVIAARKSKAFKRENGYPQVTTGLRYYQWVAELGFAAARALHYAHEAGVVHRDIKPSNLLLDKSGKLWITDFGLARIEGDGSVTMMGDCLGTLRYMSPEQVLGNPLLVDHRTDVYSLGATLYELLTLEPAVAGKREEIQCRLRVDEPRRPRQFIRDLPHDLETIVLKALADNRSERYATAGEMAADFARFLSHQTIAARRPTYFQRLAKWSRRNRTLAMSLGASLLLLMIGASVAAWFIGEAQDNVLLERQKRKHQEQLARIAQRSIVEQAYASGINIAAHAAQRNAFDGMEEALGRLIPGNSERDVRSFEWYYLAKLARSRPQLLARHEGEAYCVRFSPDGRRLATSGAGGVRIWRWPMMKCERHLSDSTADVNAVAWSPDGHVLVAMSDDKKARVYASPRWNLVKTLDFAGPLVAASFTAGGELLVIGERKIEVEHQVYGENRVHVFETRDWARRAELAATAETLRGMSVSAKGAFIAAAGHTGEIVIWDLETLRELHRFDAGVPLTTVAFAREQPIFVAGGSGSSLLTFDAASGERIGELPGIAHAQEDIAFVPSDDAVLSVGRNGTAYVWERERPTSWRLAVTFAHPHPLWSLAVHADGTLITTDRFGNIWGSNRFAPRDRRRLTSEMAHLAAGTVGSRESIYTSLAWSPDAHELAIAGYPGEVTFWDGATLRPIEVHSTDRLHIRCLAYAPNGRHLAMATYQGLICLCERKPFRILKRIQASQVQCLAFSSDGASLFAYAGNSEVPLSAFALPTLERAMDRVPRSCQGDIWWIPSNSYSFEFLLMPRESFDVNLLPRHTLNYCISGNRRTLVGHRGDDSYHVFAGPNWRPQGSFTGSQTDMALSPDGRTLAAVENYERIHLFSIATGRELMTLEPHLHGCHDIGFSPDGQRLLAVGEGLRHRGEIVVWDTADGQSERVSAR